jgi:hypothetical protein
VETFIARERNRDRTSRRATNHTFPVGLSLRSFIVDVTR